MSFSFFEFGGDWKGKATELEKKTKELERTKDDLVAQLSQAQGDARRLEEENKNEQAEAKRIVTMAKTTILGLNEKLSSAKKAYSKAQTSLMEASSLKSKVLDVQKKLRFSKGLEERLKATVEEKEAKAAELSQLRLRVGKLDNLVSSHAGLHDALVADISSAKVMLNRARGQNIELRGTVEHLRTEVVNATQEHQSFLDQISALQRENATLRRGFSFDKKKHKRSPKRNGSPLATIGSDATLRPSLPASSARSVSAMGSTPARNDDQADRIKALE